MNSQAYGGLIQSMEAYFVEQVSSKYRIRKLDERELSKIIDLGYAISRFYHRVGFIGSCLRGNNEIVVSWGVAY